jgi:hypothetical protein
MVPVWETPDLKGELYDRTGDLVVNALCFPHRGRKAMKNSRSPISMKVVPQLIEVEGLPMM